MINAFTSTAINAITTSDDIVVVEFKNGRQYDYRSADVAGFVNALNTIIAAGESVGKFVNFSINNKDLQNVNNVAA